MAKGKKDGDDEDVDFNEMWNVVYKLEEALQPIMPSSQDSDRMCPKTERDSCPSGHMLVSCGRDEGFYCKQCSDKTFQPNENWIGDKCRLRKDCNKQKMEYREDGSTVKDADCKCKLGYHFPNEDQRSCIPSKPCPKGYAPGLYGNCESCLKKSMYSNTVSRSKKCEVLTNCEKQHKCTVVRSNGIHDNVCGPVVTDIKTCEERESASTSSSSSTTTYAIACSVAGFLIFIVVIIVILVILKRQRRQQKQGQRPLTVEEMEGLRQRIVKECDRNPSLCRKVFTTSCSFIEERIDRQRWTLAQELFRPHPTSGMYEVLVHKYKDSQAKYTINGYLQEFKIWRGESKEAVSELFRCLHQVKREDIVNEICTTLRSDVGYQVEDYASNHQKKEPYHSACCPMSFCRNKSKSSSYTTSSSGSHHQTSSSPSTTVMVEAREAETKLLAIASDDIDDDDNGKSGGNSIDRKPPGTFYLAHPSPSAPAMEDASGSILPDLDSVKYSRQYSQPVQATS